MILKINKMKRKVRLLMIVCRQSKIVNINITITSDVDLM